MVKDKPTIKVENVPSNEGYISNRADSYFPAIIKWKCPICGQTNELNLMYQPINVIFNHPSVVHLICDTTGCEYEKDVLLKVNINIEILNENFNANEAYERELKEYYNEDGGYRGFSRQEMRRGNGTFLRIYSDGEEVR